MPAAFSVLAAASKAAFNPLPIFKIAEKVGIALCCCLSTSFVCVCSIAQLRHRCCGLNYSRLDLHEGVHEVGKAARVRYYKNTKYIGMGKVTFDGMALELAFLPKSQNRVMLKFMTITLDDRNIVLQDKRRSTSESVFEFSEAAEAKAWERVLTAAAREVPSTQRGMSPRSPRGKENEENGSEDYRDFWKQIDAGNYDTNPDCPQNGTISAYINCCLTRSSPR
mmetsp:Transcript_149651/g.261092  ORF Transcript_149651/g.261092 Transcript_149651/m.261092 type:complete len:223 (+) Transcript_149651:89-757(+)